jgi:hypothetical protein
VDALAGLLTPEDRQRLVARKIELLALLTPARRPRWALLPDGRPMPGETLPANAIHWSRVNGRASS